MRTLTLVVLGMVAGFLGGILLAELVGVVGLLLLGGVAQLRFLRYLPFVLALAGAVVGPVVDARRPR